MAGIFTAMSVLSGCATNAVSEMRNDGFYRTPKVRESVAAIGWAVRTPDAPAEKVLLGARHAYLIEKGGDALFAILESPVFPLLKIETPDDFDAKLHLYAGSVYGSLIFVAPDSLQYSAEQKEALSSLKFVDGKTRVRISGLTAAPVSPERTKSKRLASPLSVDFYPSSEEDAPTSMADSSLPFCDRC